MNHDDASAMNTAAHRDNAMADRAPGTGTGPGPAVPSSLPAPAVCPRCRRPVHASWRFCRTCAAPLTTEALGAAHRLMPTPGPAPVSPGGPAEPAGPAGLPPAPPTLSRRATRWRIIALVTVAAVILLGTGGLYLIQRYAYPPEGPVEDYFAALARKDTAAAARIGAGGTESPLLVDGALREGYTPPADVDVVEVTYGDPTDSTRRPNKNIAYVRVRYTIAGGPAHEQTIKVLRDRGGWLRRWYISDGALGAVTVISPYLSQVRIAAVTIQPRDRDGVVGDRDVATPAMPGAYVVTPPADDPLFTGNPVTVAVYGSLSESEVAKASVELTIKPAAAEEVTRQVRARIDECVRTARDFSPDDCPFSYTPPILILPEPTDIRWTVEVYPKIELRSSESTTGGGGVEVRTVEKGRAAVAFTKSGAPQRFAVDVNVRGPVTVEEGRVVWHP